MVYLDEVRESWRTPATEFLEARHKRSTPGPASTASKQVSLYRQGRGAGLLGARFTPQADALEIVVRVGVGQCRMQGVYDTVGLSVDEAQAALEGVLAQSSLPSFLELGPGTLEILWATSHPVDSSAHGFRTLAGLLVPLLALPATAVEEDVVHAWERHDEARKSADLQNDLDKLMVEARRADLVQLKSSDPKMFALLLAARFEHDVRQGGFAQFLYNMGGALLADVEDMLILARAPIAQEFYVRAIRACLRNAPEYQRFLASNYLEENAVKDALHAVSVEYFSKKVPFVVEAARLFATDS